MTEEKRKNILVKNQNQKMVKSKKEKALNLISHTNHHDHQEENDNLLHDHQEESANLHDHQEEHSLQGPPDPGQTIQEIE